MSEPQTEAGRSLHGGHCRYPATCDYLAAILAIETQAVAIDRAALVAEINAVENPHYPHDGVAAAGYENARADLIALLNTLPAAPTIELPPADERLIDAP